MKYLLIAEKPDLMRHIKSAYLASDIKDQIDFMSFHGHLMELCYPEEYEETWKVWSLETLPMIPTKFKYKPTDKESVNKLKAAIKNNGYDGLINACDPDREGQHIFYSFYETIKCKLPVKRIWHSDLTETELIRALKNLKDDLKDPLLVNMREASKLRAHLDWLVGMNATRALSIKRNETTRVGRVMTPTFKMLADREKEIANFKPKTDYGVEANFGYPAELYDNDKPKRFRTRLEADSYKIVTDGVVTDVIKTEERVRPPLFPSLADIQMAANKQLGYKLNETLEYIQSLYEKKMVSYPRTDCNYVTTEVADTFEDIIKKLDLDIDNSMLKTLMKNKRYVDNSKVTAHYALIPTGYKTDGLSEFEKETYDLIVKRFVAAFYPECILNRTKIETTCGNDKFYSSGVVIKSLGFRKILPSTQRDEILPIVQKGDHVKIKSKTVTEHTTKAPNRYTDASLLSAMINAGNLIEDKELASVLKGNKADKDSGGIGTPATRAAIVEKLLQPVETKTSKFFNVIREGKTFKVTPEGLKTAEAIDRFIIASPILTAEWEKSLQEVEKGSLTVPKFEDKMNTFVSELIDELKLSQFDITVQPDEDIGVNCPFCGKPLKQTKDYYMCTGYKNPCTFILPKTFNKAKISLDTLKLLVNKGETKQLKMKSKDNTPFTASICLKENKVELKFASETDLKCPNCGGSLIKRSGQHGEFYSCENKDFVLSTKIAGKKLSETQIRKLLDKGEIEPMTFKSKAGKPYNAKIILKDGETKLEFINNLKEG